MAIEFDANADALVRVSQLTDHALRQQRFIECVWPAVERAGGSWIGFYTDDVDALPEARLVLGARMPKPACSPIGLHGACGTSLISGRVLVVDDVAELGANYVACDPRDRSELVLPCLRGDGSPWGVLDLDSHRVACFSGADARLLQAALRTTGLTLAEPLWEPVREAFR